IGSRFKEERKRLHLSQEQLCRFFGVKDPKTIRSWEADTTAPDALDLVRFSKAGADVGYIITGTRLLFADEPEAAYQAPARQVAAEISGMTLSEEDAQMLVTIARRLVAKG
ncbi:MAG: helix-turn-helix domain-containing protein, partial [Georgfuchsia sp.]